jgi:hypothetical protein
LIIKIDLFLLNKMSHESIVAHVNESLKDAENQDEIETIVEPNKSIGSELADEINVSDVNERIESLDQTNLTIEGDSDDHDEDDSAFNHETEDEVSS